MPRDLSREARKEWKRITPHLEALGLISQIDRAMLVSWCRVTGLIEDLESAWRHKVDWHVANGLPYWEAVERVEIDTTPSGYRQQSALSGRLRSLREEQQKIADRFGLSPSARARVVPGRSASGQLGLPGVEDPVANKLSHLRAI